jgi:hypothetical protein
MVAASSSSVAAHVLWVVWITTIILLHTDGTFDAKPQQTLLAPNPAPSLPKATKTTTATATSKPAQPTARATLPDPPKVQAPYPPKIPKFMPQRFRKSHPTSGYSPESYTSGIIRSHLSSPTGRPSISALTRESSCIRGKDIVSSSVCYLCT